MHAARKYCNSPFPQKLYWSFILTPFLQKHYCGRQPLFSLYYLLFPRTGIDDREGHHTSKQLSARVLQPERAISFTPKSRISALLFFLPLTIKGLRKVPPRNCSVALGKARRQRLTLEQYPPRVGTKHLIFWAGGYTTLSPAAAAHEGSMGAAARGSAAHPPTAPGSPAGRGPAAMREPTSQATQALCTTSPRQARPLPDRAGL